jgi:MFS family permease
MRLREVASLRQLSYLLWAIAWIILVPFIMALAFNVTSSSIYPFFDLSVLAVIPLIGGIVAGGLAYMHWSETVPYLCTSGGVTWATDDAQRISRGFVWASWIVGGMALVVVYPGLLDSCINCSSPNSYAQTVLGIAAGLVLLFIVLRMFHQVTQVHSMRLAARDLVPGQVLIPTMFKESDWSVGAFLVPLNPLILYFVALMLSYSSGHYSSSGYDLGVALAAIIGLAGILGSTICFFQYWELNRRCRYWLRGQRLTVSYYGYVPPPPGNVPPPPVFANAPPPPPPPEGAQR